MKGAQLRKVDEEYRIHWQAFLNQAVKATKGKKSSTPKYQNFRSFYNVEKAERLVLGKSHKENGLDRFAALRAHLREEGKTDA